MHVLKLSSKGQLVIPATVRTAHHWLAGDEFVLEERPEGLLLKPRKPFPASRLDDVVGCLPYAGAAKTIEEMDQAIAAWHRAGAGETTAR
ncbi:MAG: AbrB/MazE/SpoVT family DNA-binding domain-containing protein [Defluviicoccus sp.]|nr:AbrB/MazE/SpoVT family DNA-binding domain-containing protein [Defluviicoccus sp.]